MINVIVCIDLVIVYVIMIDHTELQMNLGNVGLLN